MTTPVARAPDTTPAAVRPLGRRRGPRALRPPSAPSLLCLGDLLLDVVVTPAGALLAGSDVPGTVRFRQGGSAANTARAFARLGGRAALVAAVGDDGLARLLARDLRAGGVDAHLVTLRGSTGRLAALVGAGGERSFVTQRAAADGLAPDALREAWFRRLDVLHVPAYSLFAEPLASAAARAVELGRSAGALLSSDLSSRGPLLAFGPEAARERLHSLGPDVLFANRPEAAALVGGSAAGLLPRLLQLAPLVVVKEGAAGCRVLWRDSGAGPAVQLQVATSRVSTADTTGAGDAFAAGFLFRLASDALEGDQRSTSVAAPGRASPRRAPLPRAPLRGAPMRGAPLRPAALRPATLRRAALDGHRAACLHLRSRPADLELP